MIYVVVAIIGTHTFGPEGIEAIAHQGFAYRSIQECEVTAKIFSHSYLKEGIKYRCRAIKLEGRQP